MLSNEGKKRVTDKERLLCHFVAWEIEEPIKHCHSQKHRVKILREIIEKTHNPLKEVGYILWNC